MAYDDEGYYIPDTYDPNYTGQAPIDTTDWFSKIAPDVAAANNLGTIPMLEPGYNTNFDWQRILFPDGPDYTSFPTDGGDTPTDGGGSTNSLGSLLRALFGGVNDTVGGITGAIQGMDPTTAMMLAMAASMFDRSPEEKFKNVLYPDWYTGPAAATTNYATNLLNKPITPYGGEFTAPLSTLEQQARGMSQNMIGSWQPALNDALDYTRRSATPFTEADMASYMNPFTMLALDPVAEKMREQEAMERNALNARSAMTGSFGGTRNAVAQNLLGDRTDENIRDLYATGLKQAFDTGSALWRGDTQAAGNAATQRLAQGLTGAQLGTADVSRTAGLGQTERALAQNTLDKQYEDWARTQKEPYAKLEAATGALARTRPEPSTVETTPPPSLTNQLVGMFQTAYGMRQPETPAS